MVRKTNKKKKSQNMENKGNIVRPDTPEAKSVGSKHPPKIPMATIIRK